MGVTFIQGEYAGIG